MEHSLLCVTGELVDEFALKQLYDDGSFSGRYIADFPLETLHNHPKVKGCDKSGCTPVPLPLMCLSLTLWASSPQAWQMALCAAPLDSLKVLTHRYLTSDF